MASAHLAFYIHRCGAALPLLSLGVAYAFFGTAYWAGVARSLLSVELPEPPSLSASREPLLGFREPEHPSAEPLGESQIVITRDGNNLPDTESGESTRVEHGLEELTATGFGIATSLLNTSCTLAPMLLASVESKFGYPGLELAFVLLATFTCYASIRLWRTGLDG